MAEKQPQMVENKKKKKIKEKRAEGDEEAHPIKKKERRTSEKRERMREERRLKKEEEKRRKAESLEIEETLDSPTIYPVDHSSPSSSPQFSPPPPHVNDPRDLGEGISAQPQNVNGETSQAQPTIASLAVELADMHSLLSHQHDYFYQRINEVNKRVEDLQRNAAMTRQVMINIQRNIYTIHLNQKQLAERNHEYFNFLTMYLHGPMVPPHLQQHLNFEEAPRVPHQNPPPEPPPQ
ncbi:uncharacterized protein LOC120073694 [Benincasa hispida]|uniref:uncharacterized protein LOC120073694 n=1 Tax=Benincasa hispida TaxID=102211 RepID=UPI0018FF8608|nr:uncharacterized protein LOC120073694 [Benincasa hispida]